MIAVLRRARRLRVVRTFLDFVGPLKTWQFRVDCMEPRGWYSSVTIFFDKRIDAAAYMRVMRERGWQVSVRGERWA